MIKVLFVVDNLSYGGAQKMLTFVANNLDRKIYEVTVLNENTDIPVFRPLKQDIYILGHKQFKTRLFRRLQEIIYVYRAIKKYDYDVIVSFLDMPNVIATVSGLLCHKPVIISERGDPSQKMSFLDKLIRRFEGVCAGAVFQTEGAMEFYPPKLKNKGTIIPNPAPSTDLIFQYKSEIKNIAFVGRFENIQKRQDLMVLGLKKVVLQSPHVILHFFGSGPDQSMIVNQVHRLGLDKNVIFHGKVESPIMELIDMDMYVLTSDYEGIPNTLLEAMSIGMPCVSTDCSPGGASLLIQNKVNGLLVPTNNPELLSEAIMAFVNDPEMAKDCGMKAKEVCVTYSPDRIIDMWNQYIQRVVLRTK